MTDADVRGDRWRGLTGFLDALRSRSTGRAVAIVRLGSNQDEDAELVRLVESVSRVVVLTGATPERLDDVRSRFTRPGRVRIERVRSAKCIFNRVG